MPIAVRSGGHCFEDFVDSAQTQSIIDVTRTNEVRRDENYRAFFVGAGADISAVYQALHRGWGVTMPRVFAPASTCTSVAAVMVRWRGGSGSSSTISTGWRLYAPLSIRTVIDGFAEILILFDADSPDARARFDEFVESALDGVVPGPVLLPVTKAAFHAARRLPTDERHLARARGMYRDVYADTGGVPVPNEFNGGSHINYPDPDQPYSAVGWSSSSEAGGGVVAASICSPT
ncbi:hypothetical protein ACLMAJ_23985 [Nocardia sp. KC 131]|uniref:hypothetical protein n=1 Tax=Nocardia arseniciresistens TaxID=3392119 RepID=UPI00398F51D9